MKQISLSKGIIFKEYIVNIGEIIVFVLRENSFEFVKFPKA